MRGRRAETGWRFLWGRAELDRLGRVRIYLHVHRGHSLSLTSSVPQSGTIPEVTGKEAASARPWCVNFLRRQGKEDKGDRVDGGPKWRATFETLLRTTGRGKKCRNSVGRLGHPSRTGHPSKQYSTMNYRDLMMRGCDHTASEECPNSLRKSWPTRRGVSTTIE